MGRSLTSLVVLATLALLGACLEMAPRSSVPFQAAADRQARYTVETALAVKENRRAEASEAAANGRMVLPQLPEVWGLPATAQRLRPAAFRLDPARHEPAMAQAAPRIGCALPGGEAPSGPSPTGCRQGWQGSALAWPPPDYASLAPAAAPRDR